MYFCANVCGQEWIPPSFANISAKSFHFFPGGPYKTSKTAVPGVKSSEKMLQYKKTEMKVKLKPILMKNYSKYQECYFANQVSECNEVRVNLKNNGLTNYGWLMVRSPLEACLVDYLPPTLEDPSAS